MDRGPAPQGLQDSAQGFNPGNPQNKRFALKGREMRVPDETRTYSRAKVRVRNRDVLQLNHRTPLALFRTFDQAPLQYLQPGGPGVFPTGRYEVAPCEGASLLVDDSQG
jgi:hypothetical protein